MPYVYFISLLGKRTDKYVEYFLFMDICNTKCHMSLEKIMCSKILNKK